MIDKKIFGRIEYHFYNYHQMLHEHRDNERYEDILNASAGPADGMPRGSGISNPTLNKAMRLTQETDTLKWLAVIEELLDHYQDKNKYNLVNLIRLKYFEHRTLIRTYSELHCDRRTYYRWREQIVMDAALKAATKGLVKF